jgi:mevalonate kinase
MQRISKISNKNVPSNSYYNAKLLLSSEYLVLNGAKALAVPLKFGQQFSVEENELGCISWQSVANDGSLWFEGKYDLKHFSIIESSNPGIAIYPQRLLIAAQRLNSGFCNSTKGNHVISTLNYPLLWGLGSSSTLIAAVAGWAGIDPFQLHFEVSKGSGYDIACAISDGPIIYSLKGKIPEFERVSFCPAFADKVFFVYQGNKQDSAEGIQKYRSQKSTPDKGIIAKVNLLTNRMMRSSTLHEFEKVIHEHEIMISNLVEKPSIRQTVFTDLPGEVKSLGAWGGDFCMLTWHDDPGLLPAYLKSKSLETWFNYNDIVL